MSEKTRKQTKPESNHCCTNARRAVICLIFSLSAFISFSAESQPVFGDEWINTNQAYLRIPVTKTGFYKITSDELRSAGFPVEDVSGASLQMFRRGKELAIEVENNLSEKAGFNGSVIFFGQRNDDTPDSALYTKPEAIPHAYYSLYSDTAVYFLTAKLYGGTGKRITKPQHTAPTHAINFHFEEISELFNSHYSTGNFYPLGTGFDDGTALTAYDTGEGWTGKEFSGSWQTVDVNTSNLLSEYIDQIEIELIFVGRKSGQHEAEIWAGNPGNFGRQISTIKFSDYQPVTYHFHLAKEDIGNALLPNGKLNLSVFAKKGTISLSHVKWRYPQKTNLASAGSQKIFHFKSTGENTWWETGNANGWLFYDCSDPYNPRKLETVGSRLETSSAGSIIGVKEPLKVTSLKMIKFSRADLLQTDYLIISHPLVRKPVNGTDPVEAYAAYRASKEGGGYKTLMINSEEIFDRFNYGEPGPLGIQSMIRKLHQKGRLKFVFIIGHSADPQTVRKLSNSRSVDMIPNAGWPGSDLALAMDLRGQQPFVPAIPVGRINAETPEQVWIYLQKVKAMEAQPASAAWRKNILHLSGGRSASERTAFRGYVNSFEKKISGSVLGAHVQTLSKRNDSEVEQFPLHNYLNNGLALMTLYGHSGVDISDIDLGYASDKDRKYQNGPFYPAVIVNGCALGSIFYSNKTISTDWIFSPKNGSVLFLAHTANGVSSSLKHYTDAFYEVLADSAFTSEPFGVIQKEAVRRNMLAYPTLSNGITAQQMNLHGDPAIRIFPARLPDYTIGSTMITIADISEKQWTSRSDSIIIRIGILNNGRFRKEKCLLRIRATDNHSHFFQYDFVLTSVVFEDTIAVKVPNPFPDSDVSYWKFILDPENHLSEESESNNTFKKTFTIPQGGAFPVLPLPDYTTNQTEIELVAQVPFDKNGNNVVFEWDTTNTFTSAQRNTVAANSFIAKNKIRISGKVNKIFWRVFIPEDESRPSGFRSFSYNPALPDTKILPEGIAFLPLPVSTEIQEGDYFTASCSFLNISQTDFKDSITIFIEHLVNGKNENFIRKTAPLPAGEILNYPLRLPTIGATGEHRISVTFNSQNLPEEIYSNNQIHFSYNVIPDLIRPVIQVTVDQRQLADGDYASAHPTIGIVVIDENRFLIRNDTTGIEVWLTEDCVHCTPQRISLNGALINTILPNHFRILLDPAINLKSGNYQLRVKAMDLSGNQAPDYIINFKVASQARLITAGVGPNPSGTWFRFYFNMEKTLPGNEIVIRIYDLNGREIKNFRNMLHEGKNQWFWFPENLPSGIYFYRIELQAGNVSASSGVMEGQNGKLIWIR